jgi:hypothetical protein
VPDSHGSKQEDPTRESAFDRLVPVLETARRTSPSHPTSNAPAKEHHHERHPNTPGASPTEINAPMTSYQDHSGGSLTGEGTLGSTCP